MKFECRKVSFLAIFLRDNSFSNETSIANQLMRVSRVVIGTGLGPNLAHDPGFANKKI